MNYYYGKIHNPLRDALSVIAGVTPPSDICPDGTYTTGGMSDDEFIALQEWCSEHARPKWATGLWMLDAAEDCVRQAVENANIAPNN